MSFLSTALTKHRWEGMRDVRDPTLQGLVPFGVSQLVTYQASTLIAGRELCSLVGEIPRHYSSILLGFPWSWAFTRGRISLKVSGINNLDRQAKAASPSFIGCCRITLSHALDDRHMQR